MEVSVEASSPGCHLKVTSVEANSEAIHRAIELRNARVPHHGLQTHLERPRPPDYSGAAHNQWQPAQGDCFKPTMMFSGERIVPERVKGWRLDPTVRGADAAYFHGGARQRP